ncbi:MAG TPA: hypothetical protein VLG37_04745 [Candidatus Saccharimonadales bacterium]|nr:hypothetical protein [Candidatus Saccharimonadales bacterium]
MPEKGKEFRFKNSWTVATVYALGAFGLGLSGLSLLRLYRQYEFDVKVNTMHRQSACLYQLEPLFKIGFDEPGSKPGAGLTVSNLGILDNLGEKSSTVEVQTEGGVRQYHMPKDALTRIHVPGEYQNTPTNFYIIWERDSDSIMLGLPRRKNCEEHQFAALNSNQVGVSQY